MVLLVGCSLLASSGYCCAQELENFSDSALTAEQWQQRVQDARRKSEEFVANARMHKDDPPPPSDKEDARATDQRAMHDPSLQRGDIIATSQGFFVFVGRDSEERKSSDFLPASKPLYPP
jgi:hypothetical protein